MTAFLIPDFAVTPDSPRTESRANAWFEHDAAIDENARTHLVELKNRQDHPRRPAAQIARPGVLIPWRMIKKFPFPTNQFVAMRENRRPHETHESRGG
jgi:hypothetical protein